MANQISWGEIYCSSWWGNETNKESVLEFPEFCALIQADCGTEYTYSGNQNFPETYNFHLNSTGTSTLTYQAYNIPDKWVIIQNGVVILDTGYRGAISYQAELDAELTARGLPTETIQGSGSGTASFSINSTSPLFVYVYAPLTNTSFQTTISCPI